MLLMYLSMLETEEEKDKLEQLYINYKKLIYYIAFDYMSQLYLVEDAVHNTFLKLANYLDKIDDINSPKTLTFISIVTKNVCIDMLRKEKSFKRTEFDLEEIIDIYCKDSDIKDLLKRINKLPEIYRNVIMLKYFYEMNNRQICDITGVSQTTLKKQISRAKQHLKEVK